jgi:hypothetical protein
MNYGCSLSNEYMLVAKMWIKNVKVWRRKNKQTKNTRSYTAEPKENCISYPFLSMSCISTIYFLLFIFKVVKEESTYFEKSNTSEVEE